jgi:hypothetical protein
MLFQVIYSVDTQRKDKITPYYPPNVKKWDRTEGDEAYEYDYLGGDYKHGRHRKFCALLTRKEFDAFVNKLDLYADTTETAGMLGVGPNFGWLPAISFSSDSRRAMLNVYVCPIPQLVTVNPDVDKCDFDEVDWERVRRATISCYGR